MKLLVMLRAAIHTFLMTRATCDNRIVEMRVTQATPTRSKVEKKRSEGAGNSSSAVVTRIPSNGWRRVVHQPQIGGAQTTIIITVISLHEEWRRENDRYRDGADTTRRSC